MNRDRIYLGIVTAMIIMVIIYASYGLLNGGKEELHYSVSVVIDNSGSDQWNAFKEWVEPGQQMSQGILPEYRIRLRRFPGLRRNI